MARRRFFSKGSLVAAKAAFFFIDRRNSKLNGVSRYNPVWLTADS
jgi:hypothetical protein